MAKLVLLLGSNLGVKKNNLQTAIKELNTMVDKVVTQSKIYATDAWGNTEQEPFLNLCLIIETEKTPEEVLRRTLMIEKKMGRIRTAKQYEPRLIDIDILFYDNLISDSHQLTIPHEHIADRRFTLTPLAEILPNFIHPVHQKSILELWNECTDTLACKPLGNL
ncbi:MAG: 2-amino-4-hydroxy-6-hydroxymethyldihydropteridine diphosphokinase [Bacteroidetes bacterium]|nr:2-amino-4-hydroxy-6-hydroxymethyldihydropteridine diphosphokinase [Bacteroidota bacterium]